MRWTDSHCHLGWEAHDRDGGADGAPGVADVDAAIDRAVAEAQAAGVERLITIGTDVRTSADAIAAGGRHPGVVWATVGVHPHDAKLGLEGLVDLLDAPEVVAVGECGLDYHYDHSPRAAQREMFVSQIALAHERKLALVIHTREAWDDTFAILGAEGVPERTVFHCFTGGPHEARRCLELGAYLSFSGIVTFRTADEVRAAAALCPLDRMLVETDSPYLAPVPHRGRPNRPALLPLVGGAVAEAIGQLVDDVAAATWANAERIYALPAS